MAKFKLLLDTNIVIDYLNARQPFFEKARMLMLLTRLGEFEAWLITSQITDLVYILSDGGRKTELSSTLERLQGLRSFVNLHGTTAEEVDVVLSTNWNDPEDALLFEAAKNIGADAIVTRNADDFETSVIPAFDCDQLFSWIEKEFGVAYDEIAFDAVSNKA